ncbi:MAG: LLM class flavin-dependent oxidoreductase [Gammaproteobacteria bacterium]|jgi:5,10-methylenetetrahydromethanopterin reductase|nr:LLM class flavin-dependent oxidoreductase [Gammaproteobacteria bacterium]
MDFGIALATSTESWKVVQRAEQLGFSHAWFYDTQLLNPDVFIGMALAAANTSRIRLGTGVLIPSNRIEPVTANALASLNRLAPGRIDFGVGTGFTGRRTMAERAITLDRMKDYVQRVQALLQGEKATWPPDQGRAEIGFLNPDLGLINLEDRIDLHVSAMGPKSRRLVAELGAGWLNFAGQEGAAIKTLEDMQGAWADAGRSGEDLYASLFFLGAVLRNGEGCDSARAMAQAGPWVTVFFHNLVETTEPGSMESILGKDLSDRLEQYREVYQSYPAKRRHLHNHRGHLMFIRPDERFLVTPELIESMTFTGDVESLQARVARLAQAGYRQLTVQIVEGQEDALEDWAAVFRL